MGDVAGHGLPAASLMGKMRTRSAHALMPGTAIDIVTRADEFHRHFGGGELVTLLVGLLSSDLRVFRFVSAGHPPPWSSPTVGPGSRPNGRPNPPLGLPHPPSFTEEEVVLELRTSVLLYTDGLIERRDESLDRGLERLRSTAEQVLDDRLPNDAITDLLEGVIEGPRPTDDVAMVLLSRDASAATELEFAVEARARSLHDPPGAHALARGSRCFESALDGDRDGGARASANVVEHAYGPAGGLVDHRDPGIDQHIEARIRDSGTWRGASKGDRGNGLKLMRALMDDVIIDTSATGTVVLLRRRTAA